MRIAFFILPLVVATPAFAHPGGHGHLSPLDLLGHLTEPYHVALAVAVMLVGVGAYLAGRRLESRRAEARRQAGRTSDKEHGA